MGLLKSLQTQNALYSATAIAAALFVWSVASGNQTSAEILVVAGVASRALTANMTIVLLVAAAAGIASLLSGSRLASLREGLENQEGARPDTKTPKKTPDTKDIIVSAMNAAEAAKKAEKASKATRCKKRDADGKCIEPFDHNEEEVPKIDTTATQKAGVKAMQKALGAEGTKQMTDETNAILAQQKTLVEAMDKVTPLLNQAQSLMDSLNMNWNKSDSLSDTIAALSGK
jgi:hypothetical protein